MVSINSLKKGIGTPTGTISVWPRTIIDNDPALADNIEFLPAGYLRCDGSILSDVDFPMLASILGTGNASRYRKDGVELAPDQFQLPDLGSKKVVANSIVSDVYLNLYDENGVARPGIKQRVSRVYEGELELKMTGSFNVPDQSWEFFGAPRVLRESGSFVSTEEVYENQIAPHGHYHSGKRTRVLGRGGSFTDSRANNYIRMLSNVDTEKWQLNTYQLGCEYKFSNKTFMGLEGFHPGGRTCCDGSFFCSGQRILSCFGNGDATYDSLPTIPPSSSHCLVTLDTVVARGAYPYTPTFNYEFITGGGYGNGDLSVCYTRDHFNVSGQAPVNLFYETSPVRYIRHYFTFQNCHGVWCWYTNNHLYSRVITNFNSINASINSSIVANYFDHSLGRNGPCDSVLSPTPAVPFSGTYRIVGSDGITREYQQRVGIRFSDPPNNICGVNRYLADFDSTITVRIDPSGTRSYGDRIVIENFGNCPSIKFVTSIVSQSNPGPPRNIQLSQLCVSKRFFPNCTGLPSSGYMYYSDVDTEGNVPSGRPSSRAAPVNLNLYEESRVPFDTSAPDRDTYFTGINNVTIPSSFAVGNTAHRHILNFDNSIEPEFALESAGGFISVSGLRASCNVQISNTNFDQFVQPFIVQEYIIKT